MQYDTLTTHSGYCMYRKVTVEAFSCILIQPAQYLEHTCGLRVELAQYPVTTKGWGGGLSVKWTSKRTSLCLFQDSSTGGGCNLARFGSPEPGLIEGFDEDRVFVCVGGGGGGSGKTLFL